jgi:hypothetical protein
MAGAIIARVNQLTLIVAALVAGTHLAVIFWPRKPLSVPTDKDGRPILWHNEDEQSEDVTCVWPGTPEPATVPQLAPVASFSQAITDRDAQASDRRRSVA